jgi:hypothetical protein
MSDLFSNISGAWERIRAGQTPLGRVQAIPHDRCIPAGSAGQVIKPDEMYFSLRVNQMELDKNRWLDTKYDPLVVVVTEFNYGNARVAVPSVIGPGLIQTRIASGAPRYGTVLSDVRVTGPHPYRGGDVDVSLSFYRIKRSNYSDPILKIVENLSRAAGAAQLAAIAQTGASLLEGIRALAGVEDTVYLAGQRISLASTGRVPLQSQYQALVIPADGQDAAPRLEVQEGRLFARSQEDTAVPYRESDFLLFSVEASRHREDENLFPFYALKKEAIATIVEGEAGLKRAKANLLIAYQQMKKSDDVTAAEGNDFLDAWLTEFQAEERRVSRLASMGASPATPHLSELSQELNDVMARVAL